MKFYPDINSIKVKEIKGIGIKANTKTRFTEVERTGRAGKGSKSFFSSAHKTTFSSSSFSKDSRQLCTTKVSYRGVNQFTTKEEALALHQKNLNYIHKEGKGIDGKEPETYGSDSEEIYKENMDSTSWRIILSPDRQDIDLNKLAREFISKLERSTGYHFTWIAANHYDTPHHHTHILINGIDKNGRKVQFLPKEMVSQMMREHARNICTTIAGKRTQADTDKRITNCVAKNYFTILDRIIEKYVSSSTLSLSSFTNKYFESINKRLDYLRSLDLVTYDKNTRQFDFKKNWTEELQKLGKYNTFLEGYKYTQNCTPENYKIHDLKTDGEIEGEIVKKFIRQENSNNFALLLKCSGGRYRYVPLSFYPKDCQNGDLIKIELKKANNNIYTSIHKKNKI